MQSPPMLQFIGYCHMKTNKVKPGCDVSLLTKIHVQCITHSSLLFTVGISLSIVRVLLPQPVRSSFGI